MPTRGTAQLAIWSDIEPGQETDYLHWLTREHVLERVGVDGFLSGRVFRPRPAASGASSSPTSCRTPACWPARRTWRG